MAKLEIYTKSWCPYCAKAKVLLKNKNFDYIEIDVTEDIGTEAVMVERSGQSSVPQIFINDEPIGGHDDLVELNIAGLLNKKLGIKENAVELNF